MEQNMKEVKKLLISKLSSKEKSKFINEEEMGSSDGKVC